MALTKRQRRKRRNRGKYVKSWTLQAQGALRSFSCFSFRVLICLHEEPIRVISLTDKLPLILHAESVPKKTPTRAAQRGQSRTLTVAMVCQGLYRRQVETSLKHLEV